MFPQRQNYEILKSFLFCVMAPNPNLGTGTVTASQAERIHKLAPPCALTLDQNSAISCGLFGCQRYRCELAYGRPLVRHDNYV